MAGRFRIGEFLVEPDVGSVSGPTGTHHLEPQVMGVLESLAQHPGATVTKEELLRAVWEGRYVSDDAVHRAIGLLRKAFADSAAEQRVIQTVPKKGYRLLLPVEPLSPTPNGVRKTRSRLTLDAILASCSDHIYVFDRQERYVYASAAGARALGLTPEEMVGRCWRELGLPAEILEPFHRQVASVFEGGPPVRAKVSYPTIYGERFYEYILDPVGTENGEVIAVSAIVRELDPAP